MCYSVRSMRLLWRSEVALGESVLSLHRAESGDPSQVVSLAPECLHPLPSAWPFVLCLLELHQTRLSSCICLFLSRQLLGCFFNSHPCMQLTLTEYLVWA